MVLPSSSAGCRLASAVLLLLGLSDAVLLHSHSSGEPEGAVIPRTSVPMPKDYEDYTRGRGSIALFPDPANIPGKRTKGWCPGPDLPCFDPEDPVGSAESWTFATTRDLVGMKCAPGGKGGTGHYFYNVWVPEIVPFVVPEGTPGRKDTGVLVVPGGGFMHIVWEADAIASAEWLNSVGISAWILKYRLPNEEPSLLDAQRAMSLIRSQASKHGLNASRIGVIGDSAGGNIALRLGTAKHRAYRRIDAVDDVNFRPDFQLLLYPNVPRDDASLSKSLMPPSYIAFAKDDVCCSPATTWGYINAVKRRTRADITVSFYSNGGHGFAFPEFWPVLQSTAHMRPWKEEAVAWMKRMNVL